MRFGAGVWPETGEETGPGRIREQNAQEAWENRWKADVWEYGDAFLYCGGRSLSRDTGKALLPTKEQRFLFFMSNVL